MVSFLWRFFDSPEPETTVNPFVDVKHDRFEKAILWAYENGITKGTDGSHFDPEGLCTRKQIVAFLWRSAGRPDVTAVKNPFTDVAAGSKFEDPILWAFENGITRGKTDTTFLPDGICTRGQIVSFLYRYNQQLEKEEPIRASDLG